MPSSGPKRCKCGYAVYLTLTYTEMPRFFGCEQDELNGVEILRCPGCLAGLSADELLTEAEWESVTRRDDWVTPGSAARLFEPVGYERVESVHVPDIHVGAVPRANAGDVVRFA
jgi:hypothetical protein